MMDYWILWFLMFYPYLIMIILMLMGMAVCIFLWTCCGKTKVFTRAIIKEMEVGK